MRDLQRNQQTFYYALYQGISDVSDSSGFKTGEKNVTYGNPVEMNANISPADGSASDAIFGKDLQYSKTLVTCNMDCPIDEESVLWVGKDPYVSQVSGSSTISVLTPYNYTVTRVAKGLNSIVYALQQVDVRYG